MKQMIVGAIILWGCYLFVHKDLDPFFCDTLPICLVIQFFLSPSCNHNIIIHEILEEKNYCFVCHLRNFTSFCAKQYSLTMALKFMGVGRWNLLETLQCQVFLVQLILSGGFSKE